MKNTYKYIFAAFFSVLAMSSCERAKFLDQAPYTQVSPENFFSNETQFKLATIGAYEAMNCQKAAGVEVSGGTYYSGLMQIMGAPSDEVLTAQNAADSYGQYTDMIKASFTQSTTGLRRMWDAFYIGINRCNSVIANSGKINSVKVNHYVAEARFMRGFYYWYLAQVFGGVPIAVYQSNGQEPRANLKTVYGVILDDFKYAYENLPEAKDAGGAIGAASANKWTAAAYIGKVCNYLAACKRTGAGAEFVAEQPLNDFSWVDEDAVSEMAYTYLKDVVDNSPYKLTDDFRNLFRETTKSEQHEECLFMAENYLEATENAFPSTSSFGYAPGNGRNEANGTTGSVWARYCFPSAKIFGWYSPKDPRRDWFFVGSGKSVNDGTLIEEKVGGYTYVTPTLSATYRASASTKIGYDNPYPEDFDPKAVTGDVYYQSYTPFVNGENAHCGKYRFVQAGQITTHSMDSHSLSIPLMRLAEVYLLYAEAIYYHKENAEAEARTWLRPVLLRACKNDVDLCEELTLAYHKDDFIEELLEARERELIFEGSRKYDLFRFNIYDQVMYDFTHKVVYKSGETERYPYQTYQRFGTTEASKIVSFASGYFDPCGEAIRNNWQPFKIWAPISSLQMAANPNLTQNAQW